MKSKTFGWTVCILILAMQTFEVIMWRDDFPFAKWGMYKAFPHFHPHIDVEIEFYDRQADVEKRITDPWDIRERLWPLLGIGTRQDPIDQDIETYFKTVQQQALVNQSQIRTLVSQYLRDPSDISQVRVVFYAWKELTYKNIRQPDIEYVVFTEKKP